VISAGWCEWLSSNNIFERIQFKTSNLLGWKIVNELQYFKEEQQNEKEVFS
jgi:hypothetical protein